MDYVTWCLLVVAASACPCAGEKWAWPDAAQAPSLRIDTKVRFIDGDATHRRDKSSKDGVQSDEVPFEEPSETSGFYNRPPGLGAGAGRYPVRAPYADDRRAASLAYTAHSGLRTYEGADTVRYCKCVSSPDCGPRQESASVCGGGKYLCCYKRPHHGGQNTDVFSEIEDERPMLLPGRESLARPFPPPPGTELNGLFGPGHGHESALLGAMEQRPERPSPAALAGPGGPARQKAVLVGPGGPTGLIGPSHNGQNEVLTGPDGPRDIKSSETAQRGVLVGPGGPTGVVGPAGYGRRPVLVGPGGPTGIVGPGRQRGLFLGQGSAGYFGNNRQPGLLVGPGGPTGAVGPGRPVLVGPGGPTGQIGPFGYNHYGFPRYKRLPSSSSPPAPAPAPAPAPTPAAAPSTAGQHDEET